MYTSDSVQEHRVSTTFWQDFTIADAFGRAAVKDTFNRAFKEWRSDYKYLAELVLVLNWKLWDWYEKDQSMYALYFRAWSEADSWAMEHLRGDELSFYLAVLD